MDDTVIPAAASDNTQSMVHLWPRPRSSILLSDKQGCSRLHLTPTMLVLCPDSLLGSPMTQLLQHTLSPYGITPLFCRGCGWKEKGDGEEGGEEEALRVLKIVVGRELFSTEQSYSLLITSSSIEITASDSRGALYAIRTFCDVIR